MRRCVPAVCLSLAASGCGWLLPNSSRDVFSEDPAPDCALEDPDPSALEGLPERSVEIGELDGESFVAWSAGQDVPLVLGFQGAFMITPWVELPAEADDEDGACWHVRLQHLDANDATTHEYGTGLSFTLVDGVMRTGPIFDIPDEGFGESLRVRVTVSSESFVAVDTVEVVLVEAV